MQIRKTLSDDFKSSPEEEFSHQCKTSIRKARVFKIEDYKENCQNVQCPTELEKKSVRGIVFRNLMSALQ